MDSAAADLNAIGFDQFKKHMETSSVIEIVLKAHLLIEERLIQTLAILIPHPEHLNIKRMGFYHKVKLSGALGHISESEIASLLAFNQLRNSFAHKLDTVLTVDDISEVVTCFEPHIQAVFKDDKTHERELVGYLKLTVGFLFVQVSVITARSFQQWLEKSELDARREAIRQVARRYGVDIGAPTTSTNE